MLCNKQFGGCGHAFCYVCEAEWTKDSKHHFYCNNNIKEVRQKEIKAQKLKEELEIELIEEEFLKMEYMNGKLNSYYNIYKNIEKSIETCNILKFNLHEKINLIIAIHNLVISDVDFINEAIDCVINSKRYLKNSYIFGYYMKDGQQKKLFENSQEILESNIENLHNILIDEQLNNIIESDEFDNNLFNKYKKTIKTLIDVINKYMKLFIEEIENNYISELDYDIIDH